MGFVISVYDTKEVMMALGITVILVLGLTIARITNIHVEVFLAHCTQNLFVQISRYWDVINLSWPRIISTFDHSSRMNKARRISHIMFKI